MLIWPTTPADAAALADWAAARIPHVGEMGFGEHRAAAIMRRDDLAAVVLFHDWNPLAGTISLSMAAATPMWASRPVLTALFRYAFVTAKANKLWTSTAHRNARAVKFNEGIGMKREATLRHHFGPGSHAVICSMLRAEWQRSRWFKE